MIQTLVVIKTGAIDGEKEDPGSDNGNVTLVSTPHPCIENPSLPECTPPEPILTPSDIDGDRDDGDTDTDLATDTDDGYAADDGGGDDGDRGE
jgi:hypothetical protein